VAERNEVMHAVLAHVGEVIGGPDSWRCFTIRLSSSRQAASRFLILIQSRQHRLSRHFKAASRYKRYQIDEARHSHDTDAS
jgi:hypothetical protein